MVFRLFVLNYAILSKGLVMRNKIYITKAVPLSQQEQCCSIDVGKVLANAYKANPSKFEKEAKFDAYSFFRQIINSIIEPSKTRIVFSNLGILLEKEFELDVTKFLLEYAKDYQVFVIQGPFNFIDGNKLVWNVENPDNKIEFNPGVLEVLSE